MVSVIPPAWERALKAPDSQAAAKALCSVQGWPELTDQHGRSVWMFSLAHRLADVWPILASRPDAWSSFANIDARGRSILDYLITYGLPKNVRVSGWSDEATARVREASSSIVNQAQRFLEAPLPWPPSACANAVLLEAWASQLPRTLWGWEPACVDERWPWFIAQDVQTGGRAWGWVKPSWGVAWEEIPARRRWLFLVWGGALGQDWPSEILEAVMVQREVWPSDRRPLFACAKTWKARLKKPSPEVNALILELSWEEANKNGRRSARL